jgi:hypothetical protein
MQIVGDSVFLALVSIAGIVLSLAFGCCLFGVAIGRLFRWRWLLQQGPGFNAVVGLGGSLFFLEVWNFIYPVNHASVAVLAVFILVLSAIYWRSFQQIIRNWVRTCGVLTVVCLLLVLLTVSFFGLGPSEHSHYDTGLYYLNTIRWAREYPVVPGLANLQPALGFNQALFLFIAFLSSLANLGLARACQVVNPLFVFISGWAILDQLRIKLTTAKSRRVRLYVILLLGPLFFLATHMYISAPTSDIAAAGFALPGALAFFYSLEEISERNSSETRSWLLLLTFCAGTLLTLKLSYAVLGITAVVIAALGLIFIQPHDFLSPWIRTVVLAFVLVLPWAGRGVVLSGYPFFPSTTIRFRLDWAVPRRNADQDRHWVYSWARSPGEEPDKVLKNNAWFKPWIERNAKDPENIFLVQFVAAGLIFALLSMVIPTNREHRLVTVLLVGQTVLACVFWFKTAPDPRFGFATFLLFAANCFYAFAGALHKFSNLRSTILSCLITLVSVWIIFRNQWPLLNYYEKKFPHGFPKAEFEYATTESGLRVGIPKGGYQLWDSGLLVTPMLDPGLALRGPSIRDGFRINPD